MAARLGPPVTEQAQRAFTDGMQTALVCAAIVVATAAVAVVFLLWRRAPIGRAETAPASASEPLVAQADATKS
jgi:multisubunit Na+/H+ antiporter MnhC subunit